jgi:hypothetical protein
MSLRDHTLASKMHIRRLGHTQAGMDGVVGWFDGALPLQVKQQSGRGHQNK